MFIKHIKNIPFPEARKIVESYMGTKIYANIAQKVNQPPQDSTSIDKYQKLIEKLINLKANEWLTFQENLKSVFHWNETKRALYKNESKYQQKKTLKPLNKLKRSDKGH